MSIVRAAISHLFGALVVLGSFTHASQGADSPGQNDTERWIWKQVIGGKEANLHERCGVKLSAHIVDDVRWRAPCRSVSASFVERVLVEPRWHNSIPARGLHVVGAQVSGDLNLSGARIKVEVELFDVLFVGGVNLEGAQFGSLLSLSGSALMKSLNAEELQVSRSFFLRNTVFFNSVNITGAKVEGNFELSGSTAWSDFVAPDLRVADHFLVQGATFFGNNLSLDRANIGRAFHVSDSAFSSLSASELRVGGQLELRSVKVKSGPVQLAASTVQSVSIAKSSFDQGISAVRMRVGSDFLISDGTSVRGQPLNLSGSQISGLLELNDSSFESAVQLGVARAGMLSVNAAKFDAGFNAYGLTVDDRLSIERTTIRGEPLEMRTSKIQHGLEIGSSKIEAGINLNRAVVGGIFLIAESTIQGETILIRSAEIKGNLNISDSALEAPLDGNNFRVEGSLVLAKVRSTKLLDFSHGRVLGTVSIHDGFLSTLDLSATTIGNALLLGGDLEWAKDGSLRLSNTKASILDDGADRNERGKCFEKNVWAPKLDLQGFLYNQMGGRTERDLRARDLCWYRAWLERDGQFSHQPYLQLATVLRAAGEWDRADGVLTAARDRELDSAWRTGKYPEAFGLATLWATVGYGIGSGLLRIFYFVVGLTFLGVLVLWFSPQARRKGAAWCLGASLDHLLPIVELNKEFGDFFNDPKRMRLSNWQVAYFALHAVTGYVLGTIVVAALAGLTQSK